MDFTLLLNSMPDREKRGVKGELSDLWPSDLHFEQGHCFSLTSCESLFFPWRNSTDSLCRIFFSLVTIQQLPTDINSLCMHGLKLPRRLHCHFTREKLCTPIMYTCMAWLLKYTVSQLIAGGTPTVYCLYCIAEKLRSRGNVKYFTGRRNSWEFVRLGLSNYLLSHHTAQTWLRASHEWLRGRSNICTLSPREIPLYWLAL